MTSDDVCRMSERARNNVALCAVLVKLRSNAGTNVGPRLQSGLAHAQSVFRLAGINWTLSFAAMPSVRVRRGSQYASLLGEDELQEQNRGSGITRPRSRTLASIYQNSDPLTIVNVEDAQGAQAESSSGPERASRPGDSPPRPLSKVASSILSHQKSSELLRAPRSQDFGSAHRRRPAYASDSRLHDRTLTLEGQQADVIVPNDGRPGVLESQLSFSSAESDPFSNASENSLNHEDDIVEHLDAIGMLRLRVVRAFDLVP